MAPTPLDGVMTPQAACLAARNSSYPRPIRSYSVGPVNHVTGARPGNATGFTLRQRSPAISTRTKVRITSGPSATAQKTIDPCARPVKKSASSANGPALVS